MKKASLQAILAYLFSLIGICFASQISKKLWGVDYIGNINDVAFTDSSNLLVNSKNGILTLFNLNKKEIVNKKNFIYHNTFKIKSTPTYSVTFDEKSYSMEIIENQNLNFKYSINLMPENINLKSKFHKIELRENEATNKLTGIYLNEYELKIFDENKLKKNYVSNFSDLYIDFFFNESSNQLYLLTFNSKDQIFKVATLAINQKTDKIEQSFEFTSEKTFKSTLISNYGILVLNNDFSFTYARSVDNTNSYELINGELRILIEKNIKSCNVRYYKDSSYIFICKNEIKGFYKIFLLNINNKEYSFGEIQLESPNTVMNVISEDDNNFLKLIFIVRKSQVNNELSIEALEFDHHNSKILKSLSTRSIDLAENDDIKFIKGRKKDNKLEYVIISALNHIKYIIIAKDVSEMYNLIHQKYLNIVNCEIVTVKSDEKKKKSQMHLNTVASMIHHKDFTKILKNTYNLLINDIQDIYTNIKSSIENVINLRTLGNKENITTKNEKHFIVLYTSNSQLFILDAVTGEKKFEKSFLNYSFISLKTPNVNFNTNTNNNNKNYHELDSNIIQPYITVELRASEYKSPNDDSLVIQINLKDFSYQEIDLNLKNNFSFDSLLNKVNENFNSNIDSTPKEAVVFTLPGLENPEAIPNRNKLENKIILNMNEKLNTIFGLKINKIKSKQNLYIVKPHWNFKLNNHKLLDYKIARVPENIYTVYNSSGKILYKHIDHNVALILTNVENTNTVYVTIINTIDGKILFQTQIAYVDLNQNINSIFNENFILISYVKKTASFTRNEILTIEIMKREIEHSLISLFDKIFNLKNIFSAFNANEEDEIEMGKITANKKDNINGTDDEDLVHSNDLVFLMKTYFLPRKIKNIFVNKSKLNVSNKYIILLLETNQIYLIDKRALSPRRPIAKIDPKVQTPPVVDPLLNSPYADLESPPYVPNIVLDPKFIIDVNYINSQIDNIAIQPTKYESTFILCTSGISFSCYKTYPDKTFDYFVSIFPNYFIIIALIALFVVTFTFRRYVKKIEKKQAFINA